MTIASAKNTPRNTYTATAGQTAFTIGFEFFSVNDVKVYKNGTLMTYDANASTNTTYKITGTASASDDAYEFGAGGTVTFGSGVALNDSIVIIRDITIERTTDFNPSGAFDISTLNTQLDTIISIMADTQEQTNRSVKLSDTDVTSATVTLPTNADRASKVLSFDASGNAEATLTTTGLSTLSGITSDITTVAGIASDVTTVAGISANVTTVSGISGNVTTVAGISSDVTTTAGISSNVTTVAGLSTEITALSGVSSQDLIDVAALGTELQTLAPIASDITTVAGNATNINTVVTNIADINTTSTNISSVNTVATDITNVNQLANALNLETTFIVTVANSGSGNVFVIDGSNNPTLSFDRGATYIFDLSDSSNSGHPLAFKDGSGNPYTTGVTTTGTAGTAGAKVTIEVASNAPSSLRYYCTVHGNSMGNTISVVNNNLNTVAGSITSINTVASDIANVNTTATNITNVNTVATNITDVNTFANRYRISATDPTTSLDIGDLYYDTTNDIMKVYGSSGWQNAGSSVNGTSARFQYSVSSTTTTITGTDDNGNTLLYDAGYVDVYLNGIKMVNGSDVTVTSGNSVVFATAIGTSGTDTVDIIAYGTFNVAAIDATSITSGTLGYARGGTGLGTLGSADELLQVNAGGTALEYGKVDTANIADDAVGATQLNVSGNGTSGQVLASDGDGTFSWADAPSAFSYNAVSGTTPSLDLGSYNFFNQGALTGNTTVSFASVPTEHKWTYTYETAGASATDDVTKLVYSGNATYIGGQNTNDGVRGVHFKSDGTKMYTVGESTDTVFEFDLSTAWDLTTATYNGNSLDVSGQDTNPQDLWFKTDGTSLYICGEQNRGVLQYNLSTAWDISTATYDSTNNLVNLMTAVGDPNIGITYGITFKPDGTALWINGLEHVAEFNLSTAWDASTVSYSAGNYLQTSQASVLGSIAGFNITQLQWNSDGTKLFLLSAWTSDVVSTITFATAYDITSAVSSTATSPPAIELVSASGPYIVNRENNPRGMYVKPDGSELFTTGSVWSRVEKFYFSDLYTLTLPASVKEAVESKLPNHRVSLDFFTADGGTNVHLIGQSQNRIK